MKFSPALLILGLLLAPTLQAAGTARPNLLIIQTDENNFRTLGCYRTLLPREQAFIWATA